MQTKSESFLFNLCENTFLKLWCYPNPFKNSSYGKELCDVIAIFQNNIFLFFDRNSNQLNNTEKDIKILWNRYKKEVIEKQINTANGAERYIRQNPNEIYLDSKKEIKLQLNYEPNNLKIYKIIVAHGAEDACKKHSTDNLSGSLGMIYHNLNKDDTFKEIMEHQLFTIALDKNSPVHIFDSSNLELILKELNTISDFTHYLDAKEKALKTVDMLTYVDELDLLASYFRNFNDDKQEHFIVQDKIGEEMENDILGLMIEEGMWQEFHRSKEYQSKQEANKLSYLWDTLIQEFSIHILNNTILSENGSSYNVNSPLHKMATECRLSRRFLSTWMKERFDLFPTPTLKEGKGARHISLTTKPKNSNHAYILLQFCQEPHEDYEIYRKIRKHALEIACGSAKNRYSNLTEVIGITMEPLKYHPQYSMDIMLFDCQYWTQEQCLHYQELNKKFYNFFETKELKTGFMEVTEFPQ